MVVHRQLRAPLCPVTDEEKAARARWDYPWFGRPVRTQGKTGADFIWLGGRKETVDAEKVGALQRYIRSQLGEFRIDKKLLKKQMREAMCARFGKPVEGDGWLHAVKIKVLEVKTMIDFGGPHGNQLEYDQRVYLVRGEKRVWLLEYGGVGALLGWPQTIWCYLTNNEIPAAAELLVRLCSEFVDALPEMWRQSGLADVPMPSELR